MAFIGEILFTLIVIVSSAQINKDFNSDYLSLKNTNNLKGIAAIMILLHHISQHIEIPHVFYLMKYVGFILVAIFFFSSGYGLMYGLINKKNYLDDFLKKRLIPVLGVYWIIDLLNIIFYAINGKNFSAGEIMLSLIGIDTISQTWFVGAIVILYVGFFLSFKVSKKYGRYFMAFYIVVYCMVCTFAELHSSYTASVGAFLLGIFWNIINFGKWIREKYALKTICLFTVFLTLFLGRLFLAYKGINGQWLHILLRNEISIFFIIFILAISMKISFKGKLISWLGYISYELYLIQFILLRSFGEQNDEVFAIIVFGGSLLLAHLFKRILCLARNKKNVHYKLVS